MKSLLLFVVYLSISAVSARSQVSFGVSTGILLSMRTTSPQNVTKTQDIQFKSNSWDNGRFIIGIYLETGLLDKFRVKQELAVYPTYHGYQMLIPDNNPNLNFSYFKTVTSTAFTTLNYRALVRVLKRRNIYLFAGPSVDFNFVRIPTTDPPYYADSYPEAAELARLLSDSYNLAVLYVDAELGYNWKRFDLAINYKRSLTSQTGKFVYEGNPHTLRSVTTQFFARIGYRFIVREKK
jgi:hypothetical protein